MHKNFIKNENECDCDEDNNCGCSYPNNVNKFACGCDENDSDCECLKFDKKTKKLSIITLSIVALSGIINVLMVAFRPYTDWFVLIDIVLKVAFIFSFIITVLNVHDDVYKRISIFA